MARPSTLDVLNRATSGRLHKSLRRWADLSHGEVTFRIARDFGIRVDEATVRRYRKKLEETSAP